MSSAAFTAVITVSIGLTPISILVQAIGYRNAVVRHGQWKKVRPLSAVYLLQGWLVISVFFWIAFVSVPVSGGAANVGMASIFFWPIFPCIGLSITWIVQSWVFGTLVTLWKLYRTTRGD